jgi:Zn-dependent protease
MRRVGAAVTDFTLQQIVLRFCALLLIVGVHGAAVAGAASALGDPGPRYDGRLSVNPLAHLDLLGLVSGVLFSVGWIKPVAIDPGKLYPGRRALIPVIVVASITAILTIAFVLRLARPALLPLLGDTSSMLAFALIETIGQLGVWFALINVLPVPPLTGSYLLTALVPQLGDAMHKSHIYASVLLTGIAATGIITSVLGPAERIIARLVLGE